MIYDPLNSLIFFSLIQVVVFLFLHFHSPVLTRDRQDNRNYGEIKFCTTSFPVGPRQPVPGLQPTGWCQKFSCSTSARYWMPTHVPVVCLACTVCDSHTLSSAATSCDSWLKVGSSGPVVPDQPGETLEIHRDRGNRTWWHPPCHPLSQPASCTVSCLSLNPPVRVRPPHWLQSTPNVVLCKFLVSFSQKFRNCAWKAVVLNLLWTFIEKLSAVGLLSSFWLFLLCSTL